MIFRFVCLDSDEFKFFGTDDEAIARKWAEDELVYDVKEGKELYVNGGLDEELNELEVPEDFLGLDEE